MNSLHLRPAAVADLSAINDIYNHYVLHSVCTYQEEPETMDGRLAWFGRHGDAHPILVAVRADEIIGWGSLSPYHPRSAYRWTVEDSVYVRHDQLRQGVGGLLLVELLRLAKIIGHHSVIALIDSDQAGSIAIHQKYGFETAMTLREVGFKFGRWLDVVYMQKML